MSQDESPVARFLRDWSHAKEIGDPHAPFCTLATTTEDGFPATRIVTVREVNAKMGGVLIGTNSTSPKMRQLETTGKYELLFFWTSPTMIQYRMRGSEWRKLDDAAMKKMWDKKPKRSQLLDYYYGNCKAQSSLCKSRDEFVSSMQELSSKFSVAEVPFEATSTGLIFEPSEIEEWRGSVEDRLHERYLHQKSQMGEWLPSKVLVP